MKEAAQKSNDTFGLSVSLLGSIGLGSAIAIARLAYEAGANGLSIALPRAWLLVFFLLIFCSATGRRFHLPRQITFHCIGAGALMSYLFYGNIAAAEFIPAAVAALLFIVYPPLTTLLAAALDKRPPSPLKIFATLIAFCGLAVMLGIGFQELDWRGLLLGLSAGCVCAIQLTWVARALSGHDPLVTMTQMALVAAIILSIAAVITGGLQLPTSNVGWCAMLAAAALQAASIPLLYIAIPIIGPERSAVANNIQPVATIAVAILLVGETLQPGQFVGATMVIGGILLMQYSAQRANQK